MTQCQSETNEGREMRDDSMSAEGMQETHSSCISSGQMNFQSEIAQVMSSQIETDLNNASNKSGPSKIKVSI